MWPDLQMRLKSLKMIWAKGSQLRKRSDVSFVVMPWMSAAPDLLARRRIVLSARLSLGKVIRSVSGSIVSGAVFVVSADLIRWEIVAVGGLSMLASVW